jgi:hypothetical protein
MDDFLENWKHVLGILQECGRKSTRKELLDHWPPDFPAPSSITLYRWLEHAVGLGLVRRDGLGTCRYPFRSWLPELERDELFVHFARQERVYQEYERIVHEMGYYGKDPAMPLPDRRKARRLAVESVYGADAPAVTNFWAKERGDEDPEASKPSAESTQLATPAAALDPSAAAPTEAIAPSKPIPTEAVPPSSGFNPPASALRKAPVPPDAAGAPAVCAPESDAKPGPKPSAPDPYRVHPSYLRSH